MRLFGGHAAHYERELRGYRFLWNGVQGAGSATVFRNLAGHAPWASVGIRLSAANGALLRPGFKGYQPVPVDCQVMAACVVADAVGSIMFDIYRCAAGAFPPAQRDTLTPLEIGRPKLKSAQANMDFALFGWTSTLNRGDVLGFDVLSVSGLKSATLTLLLAPNHKP